MFYSKIVFILVRREYDLSKTTCDLGKAHAGAIAPDTVALVHHFFIPPCPPFRSVHNVQLAELRAYIYSLRRPNWP